MRSVAMLLSLTAALVTVNTFAQEWPSKPVRIVVGFGAGGVTDVLNRIMADQMSKLSGGSFIVENRPGANSVIGTAVVAKRVTDFLDIPALVSVSGVVSYKSNSWGLF